MEAALSPTLMAQFGIAGVVLAWFMFRVERRMDDMRQALDRLTRAQMLTLLARPDVDEAIKSQVRSIMTEMAGGAPTDLASVISAQKPV
jgi:hypothetical protein